ncbi:E1-E2 ATPase, putative, partial [Hepatocystis sp. ex Piliocolobus tephrosceles]
KKKKKKKIQKYSNNIFLKNFINRINNELIDYDVQNNINDFSYVLDNFDKRDSTKKDSVSTQNDTDNTSVKNTTVKEKPTDNVETVKNIESGEHVTKSNTNEVDNSKKKVDVDENIDVASMEEVMETDDTGMTHSDKNGGRNGEKSEDKNGNELKGFLRNKASIINDNIESILEENKRKSPVNIFAEKCKSQNNYCFSFDENDKKQNLIDYILFDNNFYKIHGKHLIVGDIVYLFKGDIIPADGILIKSKNMVVDETNILKYNRALKRKIGLDDYMQIMEKTGKKQIFMEEVMKPKVNYFEKINLKIKKQLKKYSKILQNERESALYLLRDNEYENEEEEEKTEREKNKISVPNRKLLNSYVIDTQNYRTSALNEQKVSIGMRNSNEVMIEQTGVSITGNTSGAIGLGRKSQWRFSSLSYYNTGKKFDLSPLLLSSTSVVEGMGIMVTTCVSKYKQMFHKMIRDVDDDLTAFELLINGYAQNVIIIIIFCCSLCILLIFLHFFISLIENSMQTLSYHILVFLLNTLIFEILKYLLVSIDQFPLLLQNNLAFNSDRIVKENFIIKNKKIFERVMFTNTIFIDMDRYIKYKCIYFFYNHNYSVCFDSKWRYSHDHVHTGSYMDSNTKDDFVCSSSTEYLPKSNPTDGSSFFSKIKLIDNNMKLYNSSMSDFQCTTRQLFFLLLIQCIFTTSNLYHFNVSYSLIDLALLKFMNNFNIGLENFFIFKKYILHIIEKTSQDMVASFVLFNSLLLNNADNLEDEKKNKNHEKNFNGESNHARTDDVSTKNQMNVIRIFIKGSSTAVLSKCCQYLDGDKLCRFVCMHFCFYVASFCSGCFCSGCFCSGCFCSGCF